MKFHPVKVLNFICLAIGAITIGFSLNIGSGVGAFLIGFALLPADIE